jgi:outer membrane protein TolC
MGFRIRGGTITLVVALELAWGISRGARAEPAAPLAQLIAVAVRNSPDLAHARIDLEAARAELIRAEGREDTHLGARGQGARIHASSTDPNGDSENESLELSASRALPTGGTLSLIASGQRAQVVGVAVDAAGKVTPQVVSRYAAGLAVELVQPLLRGAGAAAFEAPIRQAEIQRDAAALRQEARARDLVVSIAQAYWQVAFAWRQLEVRKASLELAQQQLAYTEGAIRADKVAKSETLAVLQAIATRKQDVIAGEQELYERSVALRQLGGLEIGPDALTLETEPLPGKLAAEPPDPAQVLRTAFDRSPELAALEASRRAAEVAAGAADNAARSRLDLDVSAGPIGADATLDRALSSAIERPGYEITAGVTFDRAIERRTERGGQAAARAAVTAAKLAEREARVRLAVRATRAAQRARAALASIALGDQAIGLAEQNITAEQARFSLGKSTNFEVLRRQDELEQARLRQASAVADYLAARAELDGLGGTLLARYGIVMP